MLSVKTAKYHIALFSAVFIWSSAFIVTKVALTDLGPFTLSAIRIFIAFIVLLPVALKRGFHFNSLFTKRAFIYGIFGYGGDLVLLSFGLATCTASIAAIIQGLFPIFMILLGHYMLKESITKDKVLGIIFSVAGVFIASVGNLSQNSGMTILGIGFIAASVLSWAFYSVYSKKAGEGTDSFVLTEICSGAGFLCVLPFAVIELVFNGFAMPGADAIFSLFYLGVISGALGLVLWIYGMKKVDSTVTGIYYNLVPVIGLSLAFFAHERITFLQLAGSGLALVGVFIGTRQEKQVRRNT